MGIIGLTEKEDTIFSISERSTRMSAFGNFQQRYVQLYAMNYSMKKVERSVYNWLMLLGDVGGLYGLLFSIFAIINSILSY